MDLNKDHNSLILSVNDLEAHFVSDKFAYDLTGLWVLPIEGYCDVKMKNVKFSVEI